MGWFFGFNLHIVINDRGEIFDFVITQANVDDREPLKNRQFHEKLFGKIFADRRYISQYLQSVMPTPNTCLWKSTSGGADAHEEKQPQPVKGYPGG
jgi:hypothetical protein